MNNGRHIAIALLSAAVLGPVFNVAGQVRVRGHVAGVPEDLIPVFNQGVQALQTGQYDAAEVWFQEVLKKAGPSALVLTNLGTVWQQRGNHKKAVEILGKAVRLEPRTAPPRVLLGSSLLALGKIPEATTQLEAAVRIAPKDPLAHLQLAKAYARAKNPLKSLDEFRAARALVPADPDLAYRLGNSYLELSVWALREIMRLNPVSPRVDQIQAENLRAQGRYELALKYLQFAAGADPMLPEVRLAMAEIYFDQNKFKEALDEVNLELRIVPYSARALALKEKLEARAAKTPE